MPELIKYLTLTTWSSTNKKVLLPPIHQPGAPGDRWSANARYRRCLVTSNIFLELWCAQVITAGNQLMTIKLITAQI